MAAYPLPAVAGMTQGWDSIPSESYSKPNGGSGDSFDSGPQFPYGTAGCLSFDPGNPDGCSDNGGAQGCHTVHVMAWDNQGNSTGDKTYGPLCYDAVAPTIAIDTSVAVSNTGWFNIATGDPYVSLVATDPGGSNASGVKTIYGVLGPTDCSPTDLGVCQIYGPPFQLPQGANPITAFSLDNAANFSSVAYETLYVDTVAPVTTDSLVGEWNNGTSTSAVQANLSATDATSGVEYTYYTLEGGSTTQYTGPFYVNSAGSHTLKYWSVDWATNTEAQHTATFAIQSPTTATIVATPNPSLLGQSVTMTATVKAALTGTPTGTVQFWNGATSLGTATLSGGVATLATSALPIGALTLQASFLGSTYYAATNSAPFDQTVNESTTTTVTPSANPTVYAQSVTLTATVTPSNSGVPTGSASFWASGIFVGTGPLNGSGVASVTSSFVPGSYSITATYSGDSTYLTSTSTAFTETVNKATQAITFTDGLPASAPYSAGLSYTLSATGGASGQPVTFSLVSGPGSLSGTNNSTLTIIGGGNVVIAANQAGNANYAAAPQATQSIVITQPASLTSPTPGSALTGSSATFNWSAGVGVTKYEFLLGTTGPGSDNLDYLASATALSSGLVSNIPTNGMTLYARLYSLIGGVWQHTDYTYTELGPASLISPAPGSTLTGSTATFGWTTGGGVTKYEFLLGTTGPGSDNLDYLASATALSSGLVSDIPTNGMTLYARLYSLIGGVWQHTDYTYTEAGTPVPAALISPAPGSTLTGSTATFGWTAGGGVTKYEFLLGTTGPGSDNLDYLASATALSSGLVSNIPTYGATLYARLYSLINGVWQYTDYTYTESGAPVPAALTSPAPGSTLTGSSATFNWTAGGGVTKYEFLLGTKGKGSDDLDYLTSATALSSGLVSNIPTTGGTLYARLYSLMDGVWQYTDYTYTEQ